MSAKRGTLVLVAAGLIGLVTTAPAYADGVRSQQWYLSSLDLPAAHAVTKGTGVVVAVVDSGVDVTHPDLQGSVLSGTETAGTKDTDGRGTALASLVAGHGHGAGGADGVLGVAPGAQILPVAFAPKAGEAGDPAALAAGIDLAVSKGAKVVCVGRGVAPNPRLREAVEDALDADVLVVAADGDVPNGVFSPWPSSILGVLTAIPLDRAGNVAVPPASRQTSGVGVPGTDLISATSGGGYRLQTGATGTGLLCGAAALVRSAYPQMSAEQVADRLRETATDKGPVGPDSQYGAGVLNLKAALAGATAAPSGSPSASHAVVTPEQRPVGVALTDSRDWRRWLVVVPLVIFLAGLGAYAFRRKA
ncbi:S8 family serine peptidase [Hamadaea sp. NPDC051192]|uniref:S8 family serine peptidase n=1 Tax=Hamadaea sp. NPDC051192 TaxID=3154940 RepID=UPI00343E47DB